MQDLSLELSVKDKQMNSFKRNVKLTKITELEVFFFFLNIKIKKLHIFFLFFFKVELKAYIDETIRLKRMV